MTTWLHDLRFALRTLGKQPTFTGVVVLILGLGMGATTAVLDLTNLLAWRPVPVERPAELAKVFTAMHRGFVGPYGGTPCLDYLDYRDASTAFGELAAHHETEVRVDTGAATDLARVTAVSGNYFSVLRLGAYRGRPLVANDDRAGATPVVVLGDRWWRRQGADPEILGSILTLEGEPFTVVGIAPRGFVGTNAGMIADLFVPLAAMPRLVDGWSAVHENRQREPLGLIGRLRPGISHVAAQAELQAIAGRLDREHPISDDEPRKITVTGASFTHPVDLERSAPSLRLFAVAVVVLLIITCANVAHLLLARAVGRGREMAVRQSLGAGRGRLVRQVFTEHLVLAIAGGACGLLFAWWARAFFTTFAGADFASAMRFDWRVLGGSFAVCLVAALLSGLMPAIAGSRTDLVAGLKGDPSGAGGGRRWRPGSLLAAAQVGLCVVLLVVGAWLARGLWERLDSDFGFETDGLMIAALDLPSNDYDRASGAAFFQRLRDRAAALPGVDAVGRGLIIPPILFDVSIPVVLPEDPQAEHSTRLNIVDEHYFSTMGLRVERGRGFTAADGASDAAVVVINQPLAETLWSGEEPLGRILHFDPSRPGDLAAEHTVVGVVSGVRQHRAGDGHEPMVYFFSGQRHRSRQQLVVRSSAEAAVVLDGLRGLLREMDPGLALTMLRTGHDNRREALTFERMQAQAVGVFAV
ncbi:MAG: ABC transporter permease, partial [Acidobacteriota bacterium]